jgi:hypothetical protein
LPGERGDSAEGHQDLDEDAVAVVPMVRAGVAAMLVAAHASPTAARCSIALARTMLAAPAGPKAGDGHLYSGFEMPAAADCGERRRI